VTRNRHRASAVDRESTPERQGAQMHRILIIGATVAIAATVAAAALGQSRGATVTNLKGTVGPGYSISLTKAGKKVKTLKAGTYKITVADKSPSHNFTLEKETKPNIEKHVSATG